MNRIIGAAGPDRPSRRKVRGTDQRHALATALEVGPQERQPRVGRLERIRARSHLEHQRTGFGKMLARLRKDAMHQIEAVLSRSE
jgi:hypothetical protein